MQCTYNQGPNTATGTIQALKEDAKGQPAYVITTASGKKVSSSTDEERDFADRFFRAAAVQRGREGETCVVERTGVVRLRVWVVM